MNLSISMPWKGLVALRPLALMPCLYQRSYFYSTQMIIPKTSTKSVTCRRPLVPFTRPSSSLRTLHAQKRGRVSRRSRKQTARKEEPEDEISYKDYLAQHGALPGGENDGKLYVVSGSYRSLHRGIELPIF